MDILEEHLPDIVGEEMNPFAPWKDKGADDSIINAASKHHRPDTCLQWIIATADRLASGFERETFDVYNAAIDETKDPELTHYTVRQETLFERIRLTERPETSVWRYPLKPFSPRAIYPAAIDKTAKPDNVAAQHEYLNLWNIFKQALAKIPVSHRSNLPLWLDHFESLWLVFTHAIPSATTGISGKVRPDVSLFDHSKATAALAVGLWRYHHDLGHASEIVREQLRVQWDKEREHTPEAMDAWNEEKYLLVQGDFFGIQNFIFAQGGQTQKSAAKLLRGRSFYVSLLTELAALKVLDVLNLPSTSQVVNAAGKFLIVAHNTKETIDRLHGVQAELEEWFLSNTWGQSGVGLAWLPAAARDFRQADGGQSPFRNLMKKLFEQLETAKMQRFELCGRKPAISVFHGFLDRFVHRECQIDGRSPATREIEKDVWVSTLAFDQIQVGKWLVTEDRLLVTGEPITPRAEGQSLHKTELPIFGYHLLFTREEERSGKFGNEASSGNLLRAWDFSLPEDADAPLWDGYARRNINGFVPRFKSAELNNAFLRRYEGMSKDDRENERIGTPKTLNHLARDDQHLNDETDEWIGVEALMTFKGDVDNLGKIFQTGLHNPTFAKMAALSRQMNSFFTVYLPWLCKNEFPNTYTVFAGGDDFFLIGPWLSMIKLAQRLKNEFVRYVAENQDIHFSVGFSMTKPGFPIRHMAILAEEALEKAKTHNPNKVQPAPKNAVASFDQPVTWAQFDLLMEREKDLRKVTDEYALSKGYLYGLLHLTEMAGKVNERPENAIWHSYFRYRTRRFAETRYRDVSDRAERERQRQQLLENLAREIKIEGIEKHQNAYKITLFTYLYQERD